jgi:RNAse (barnase) inhibitor barstar
MKTIVLDGATWKTTDDFYDAFFKAVGAPGWHGRNFNALRDSIITGHINQIEIPYTIHILGTGKAPPEVRELVRNFCSLIEEFHAEGYEVDVSCQA